MKVEVDEGTLYFDELIAASGNSALQITFFDMDQFEDVTKSLEKFGCGWEGSHIPSLISVNVPKEIDYSKIKTYLEAKLSEKVLDYKEACLGFK